VIKNELQYRVTKSQIERLEESLNQTTGHDEREGADPLLRKLHADSHESLIMELRDELDEYRRLKNGEVTRFECHSLVQLPRMLIKARIARGLTHKALGDLLSLKEQQIQQYEATDYEAASFTRLVEVATVLCIDVKFTVMLGEMHRIPSVEELAGTELVPQSA